MQTGWLAKAGRFNVEHVPCPHPSTPVDQTVPAKGVQHTTEGSTVEAALAVFRKSDAPHFVVGRDQRKQVRVLQLVPLGYAAAALKHTILSQPTNGYARVQIELVGFSQHSPWLPDSQVAEALASLYRALTSVAGVPMTHFENPSRSFTAWKSDRGWCGHADVPQNDHWDPGRIDWQKLFDLAHQAPWGGNTKPKPKPIVLHPTTYILVRRSNGLVYTEPVERPH